MFVERIANPLEVARGKELFLKIPRLSSGDLRLKKSVDGQMESKSFKFGSPMFLVGCSAYSSKLYKIPVSSLPEKL